MSGPSNVVTIGGEQLPERRLSEDQIARLRGILAQAEAGQLDGYAIAISGADDWLTTEYAMAPRAHRMALVGEVAMLQRRMLAAFDHD